ncbi:MAG TPA: NADH-quinone oxidoreductase subunit M, partial [Vicinamibacterales bacterium]
QSTQGALMIMISHGISTGALFFLIGMLYERRHTREIADFGGIARVVPVFPFHTWLPDAHVEAPTAGSVILASVMLKIGTYGFLRFAVPFFPDVAMSPFVSGLIVVLAVIGISWVHQSVTGEYSFDLLKLYDLTIPQETQRWFFLAFTLAFIIKVPLFPFHTWLPDAHVQAPTAGSVILAGVMLKMGGYGLIRLAFPLFPEAALYYAPLLAALSVIAIVYGALVAMVQPDMKKLVAYSSVSHMGFVILGIAAANIQGIQGASYQMLAHGVSTGALFCIVGMLSDRRHTRLISEFGGLKTGMPRLTAVMLIITLSSIGLPGMNGFIGEFLIMLGAFKWDPRFVVVAALGVILSAVYMLWMFQRVFNGKVTNEHNKGLPDLSFREWAIVGPLAAAAIAMGVVPNVFLKPMEPAVQRIVDRVQSRQPVETAEAVIPYSLKPRPKAALPKPQKSKPQALNLAPLAPPHALTPSRPHALIEASR